MSETVNLRYPGLYARQNPDKLAVVMSGSGKTLSYGELDAYAWRLAHLYRSLGLQPGDHVAFCVENRLECLVLQWGTHYAGLYEVVPIVRTSGEVAEERVRSSQSSSLRS